MNSADTATPAARTPDIVPWLVAGAWYAAVLAFVSKYGLTLPYWDQWDFVPTLDRMFDGRLRFQDLWAQHNAHRIVFPRLVMLSLARFTRWNIAAELAVNVICVALIFALFLAHARRIPSLRHTAVDRWLPAIVALLVFTLAQWQNLAWGWQMQIFMNVAAALAGLLVLAGPRQGNHSYSRGALNREAPNSTKTNQSTPVILNEVKDLAESGDPHPIPDASQVQHDPVLSVFRHGPVLGVFGPVSWLRGGFGSVLGAGGGWVGRLGVAWALGVVATFSFASGHAYWVAGLTIIPWTMPRPGRCVVVWILGAAVVVGAYAIGFEITPADSNPRDALANLSGLFRYALTFVGGGIVSVSNPHRVSSLPSTLVGAAGVATFLAMFAYAWRRPGDRGLVAPLAGIALYAAGSAFIAGLGRLDEGSGQALASRYATIAAPFWVAWTLLALHTLSTTPRPAMRQVVGLGIAVMLGAAAFNSARGANAGAQRCHFVLDARTALIAGEDDALLQRLYPNPGRIRELRPILQEHRLSVFR